MTIHTNTHISCEHLGCNENFSMGHFGKKTGPRDVRKAAKIKGWSRVGGKDYCPDHKPTYKRVLVPAG